jgi:small-conductance mechanosensitive channel
MNDQFSPWTLQWATWLIPMGRIFIIVLGGWLLNRIARRIVRSLGAHSILPAALILGLRRFVSFFIAAIAFLLILKQLGVSAANLWAGITGFVAVGAVAFFAAWSVLSNIFCTLLIVMTRPFRLYDRIEIVENGEKPGLKGQVTDVNLIFTTLTESVPEGEPASVLQVPNSLFFQRIVRRWKTA